MSARVVVIGSINVDLFAQVERHPEPGETLLGDGGRRAPGGKGANQALAARLQGADVTLVGSVGHDADAEIALSLLREAGVDLTGVTPVEDLTGLAIITVSAAGENTIVVIPGANSAIDAARVEQCIADLNADDVVVLQGELPHAVTQRAARAAAARGLRVIFNVAPWAEYDHDVLMCADPLVLNEHEARQTLASLGGPEVNAAQEQPQESFASAARWLVEQGAGAVVVTLGGRGAVIADDDGATHVAGQSVQVKDTTGAGDAFVGALAARLVAGDDLATAAQYANTVGAYVVQRSGAQPSYPRAEEIHGV